jgi:transposase-like protein
MGKRNAVGQFLKGTHWRDRKPFWERAWCVREYVELERSTGEIAKQFGVTDAAVIFWLRRHKIKRRTVSQARAVKHWGQIGPDNPMWNRLGELNPNWKGGISPERQAFYASAEWKKSCRAVWKRDGRKCRRCLLEWGAEDMPFCIHHVESFAVVEKRADTNNLMLMCEVCHLWVHSRRNKKREYLR